MDKQSKDKNSYLSKYSSKVSRVFIEIHNFNFRHGVFDGNDKNFIGREEIRNRLRAVFSNSDSNSGTYLLTGNRGVGKTSLINKVLSELSAKKEDNIWMHLTQYFILFVIIVGITIIDRYLKYDTSLAKSIKDYAGWQNLILLLCFIFSSFYVGYHSLFRKKKNKLKHKIGSLLLSFFKEILTLYRGKQFERKLMKIAKYLSMISCIMLIGNYLCGSDYIQVFSIYVLLTLSVSVFYYFYNTFLGIKSSQNKDLCKEYRKLVIVGNKYRRFLFPFIYTFMFSLIVFFLYKCLYNIQLMYCLFFLLVILIMTYIQSFDITKIRLYNKLLLPIDEKNKKFESSFFYGAGLLTIRILKRRIQKHRILKKLFNRSTYICIKINLGYDNLKTLDVLKLVAYNIDREYKQFIKTGATYWIRRVFLYTSCFLIAYFFYTSIEVRIHNLFIPFDSRIFISENKTLDSNISYLRRKLVTSDLDPVNRVKLIYSFQRIYTALADTTQSEVYKVGNVMDVLKDINRKSYLIQDADSAVFFRMKMADTQAEMRTLGKMAEKVELRNDYQKKTMFFWQIIKTIIEKTFKPVEKDKEFFTRYYSVIREEINSDFNQKRESMGPVFNALFSLTFWIIIIICFVVIYFLLFYRQKKILRKFKELEDSIAADIKKEESVGVEKIASISLKLGHKKEKSYLRSDVQGIEKQLINILKDISVIHIITRPQFIVVFDELDKIEPDDTGTIENLKTNSYSPQNTRSRQQTIFSLLSGLKYFLTTAQAKFIFVTGREIYDASLADVADRNYYVSSIFHDVINVPSFMSDFSDKRYSDICSMTEQYVCQHLFPQGYIAEKYDLAEYAEYIDKTDNDELTDIYGKADSKSKKEEKLKREMIRKKIIILLDNFILYLTHVGKGAPKKMISIFEKYVEKHMPYIIEQKTEGHVVFKKMNNTIYYLSFSFYQQYCINLTAYLVNPIILRFNSTNAHKHGDKLLVNSLFFLDHLYKFHRNAFSWRALESSPELIDINKTPELRMHIKDLLHYLSQNHIKQVDNGLYHFRFYKKIALEIDFLTRISEDASAIYNFTLDESYNVKQYYWQLLKSQQQQFEDEKINVKNRIIPLSSLHFTLGELHLLDEEVEEAIIEFNSCISILLIIEPLKMTPEQVIILIKSMLCLGIAYEKKNLNDQAFLVYTEIVKLLISSRDIDIKELGLQTKEEGGQMRVKYDDYYNTIKAKKELGILPQITEELKEFIYDKNGNRINKNEERLEPHLFFKEQKNWEHLTCLLDGIKYMHPIIHSTLNRITSYEGLRIFYLPLLAKFQIMEKSQVGGIRLRDVKRLIKEFAFLSNMVNKDSFNILFADFYARLGDILYYKNSQFIKDIDEEGKNKDFAGFFPYDFSNNVGKEHEVEFNYDGVKQQKVRMMCIQSCGKCNTLQNESYNKTTPCDACHFYKYSALLLIKDIDSANNRQVDNWIEEIIKNLEIHRKNKFRGWDESRFNLLARILSNLGDTMLSCLDEDKLHKIRIDVKPNTSENYDTAIIKFKIKSQEFRTQVCRQPMKNSIAVIPSTNIVSAQGGCINISIKSDIDWEATSNQPWAVLRKYRGKGHDEIKVDIKPNISKKSDVVCLTFKAGSEITQISIYRHGKSILSFLSSYTISAVGDYIDIPITSEMSWEVNQSWIVINNLIKQLNEYIKFESSKEFDRNERSEELEKIKTIFAGTDNLTQLTGLYLLSAWSYKKGTSFNMESQQYVKILNTFKAIITNWSHENNPLTYSMVKDINEYFSYHAIKGLSNSYKDVHFVEIKQMEDLFKDSGSYRNLLMINDVFEVALFYTEIKYRCKLEDEKKGFLYKYAFIDRMFKGMSYALNSSIYNRIMLLSLKSKVNKEEFCALINNKKNIDDKNKAEAIEYYIIDSIFNLTEIIKFSKLYDETYLLTNIFIAEIHKELMCWYILEEFFDDRYPRKTLNSNKKNILQNWGLGVSSIDNLKSYDLGDSFRQTLDDLIGKDKAISSDLERANAIRAYYKAKEMYNEGRTYKNMIERGCYLNDEFNDRKFHFKTATECCKINSRFEDYIKNLKDIDKDYKIPPLYDPEMYLYMVDAETKNSEKKK